jgi:hypothetical protein
MSVLSWSATVVEVSIRIHHLNLLLHLHESLSLYEHGDLLVSCLTQLLKSDCFTMVS